MSDELKEIRRIAQRILSTEMDRHPQYRCEGNTEKAHEILALVDKLINITLLDEMAAALERVSNALAASDAMLPYGGQLLEMAHYSVDEVRAIVQAALTKYKQFKGD